MKAARKIFSDVSEYARGIADFLSWERIVTAVQSPAMVFRGWFIEADDDVDFTVPLLQLRSVGEPGIQGVADLMEQHEADVILQIEQEEEFARKLSKRAIDEDEDEEFDGEEDVERLKRRNFDLGKAIGTGGFKTVHLGKYDGKDVAIGVITHKHQRGEAPSECLTQREITMIEEEISMTEEIRETKINGEYICRSFIPRLIAVYKQLKTSLIGISGCVKSYFIIMDLGSGDISKKSFYGTPNAAIGAAIQMTMGVKCVHQAGYIHKDVKPLNFLASRDGTFIWTNDFGLAAKKVGNDHQRAKLASRWGTPYYMPKELASESLERYDTYALWKSFDDLAISQYLGTIVDDLQLNTPATFGKRTTPTTLLEKLATLALKPLEDKLAASTKFFKRNEIALAEKTRQLQASEAKLNKLVENEASADRGPATIRRFETLTGYIKKYDDDIDALHADLKIALKRSNDLSVEIDGVAMAKNKLVTALAEAQSKLDNAKLRHMRAMSELERIRDGKTNLLENLINIVASVHDIAKQEVIIAKKEVDSTRQDRNVANSALRSSNDPRIELSAEKTRVDANIMAKRSAIDERNKRKGLRLEERSKLEAELKEIVPGDRSLISRSRAEIEALKVELRAAEDAVDVAKAKIARIRMAYTSASSALNMQSSPDSLITVLMSNRPLDS